MSIRPLSALFVATACAASPSPQAHKPSSVPSNAFPPPSASAAPPLAAPTSAAELNARLLAYLSRAQSASDLTVDQFESMVIKLDRHPTDSSAFGTSQKLDTAWTYSVELRSEAKSDGKRLWLRYSDNGSADMLPVCAPDYDGFAQALVGAGYVLTKQYGEHGRFISGDFARDGLLIKLYPRGENNEKASHLCVQMMLVDASLRPVRSPVRL
jgi:hypothetical protein